MDFAKRSTCGLTGWGDLPNNPVDMPPHYFSASKHWECVRVCRITIASICLLVGGAEILATCRRIFGKVDCYMTDIHVFLIGELQNETITVAEMRILRKV